MKAGDVGTFQAVSPTGKHLQMSPRGPRGHRGNILLIGPPGKGNIY